MTDDRDRRIQARRELILSTISDGGDIHIVRITERRIECVPWCPVFQGHVSEYRALDVNPDK